VARWIDHRWIVIDILQADDRLVRTAPPMDHHPDRDRRLPKLLIAPVSDRGAVDLSPRSSARPSLARSVPV